VVIGVLVVLPEDPLLTPTDYFLTLRARFADQGLAIEEAIEFNDWPFDIVARHVRYDVVAVPVYLEEFFLVTEFGLLGPEEFVKFCASGWAYAEGPRTPRSSVDRGLRLPPLARFGLPGWKEGPAFFRCRGRRLRKPRPTRASAG